MIMDYCAGGSVKGLLLEATKQCEMIPFGLFVFIVGRLTKILGFLYTKKIKHNDFHPRNWLLKFDPSNILGYPEILVCDFGLATNGNEEWKVKKQTQRRAVFLNEISGAHHGNGTLLEE